MKPANWRRIISAGKRKRNPVEIGFCITSLQTGRSQMVTNITHPSATILRKAMIASACEPFLMPTIDVFGDGDQWVDGGVRDINPARYIKDSPMESTINSIMAISSQRYEGEATTDKFDDLLDTLLRLITILVQGVFDDDVDYMEAMGKLINKDVFDITPTKPFTGDGLVFDPKVMAREIKAGFRDARKLCKFE